jgi:hypothetical protein
VRRFALRDAGSDSRHAQRRKIQGKACGSFHFRLPMQGVEL